MAETFLAFAGLISIPTLLVWHWHVHGRLSIDRAIATKVQLLTAAFIVLMTGLAFRRRRLRKQLKEETNILSRFQIRDCMLNLADTSKAVRARLERRKIIFRVGDPSSTWYSPTDPNNPRN